MRALALVVLVACSPLDDFDRVANKMCACQTKACLDATWNERTDLLDPGERTYRPDLVIAPEKREKIGKIDRCWHEAGKRIAEDTMMATTRELADAACACTDKPCTSSVMDRAAAFTSGLAVAPEQRADVAKDADFQARYTELSTRYTNCIATAFQQH